MLIIITSLCNFAYETFFYSEKLNDTQRILTDLEKKHKNLSTKFYTVLSNDNIEESDKLFKYIASKFYDRIIPDEILFFNYDFVFVV